MSLSARVLGPAFRLPSRLGSEDARSAGRVSAAHSMVIVNGGVGSSPFSPRNDAALYTVGIGQSAKR
jgi:hypothetical protein